MMNFHPGGLTRGEHGRDFPYRGVSSDVVVCAAAPLRLAPLVLNMYAIVIADTGETFSCAPGQSVLAALERSGRRAIRIGCRGGGCGVCRVEVVGARAYRALKMSRAQVTGADADAGIALACKLIPEGDLVVRPLGPRPGGSPPAAVSP